MTIKPNGTDAKDIALHFIKATSERATPQIIAKTIIQAKTLLQSGYTVDEVIQVIDYLIDVKKVQMYSLGYVGTCINNVLKELNERKILEEQKLASEMLKKELEIVQAEQRIEVVEDVESAQRNRDKLSRFGDESRKREKYNLNMFEGK